MMTSKINTVQTAMVDQFEFQAFVREKMRAAIRFTLATVLEEEVSAVIGAHRYERTDNRRDQRNGTYTRDLGTGVGVIRDLAIPRTRKGFQTRLFEQYRRRQAELDTAIGDMFVYGTSMTRVGDVVETLTGQRPSPSTVSRVFHSLDEEFEVWKKRALSDRYRYIFLDGTYFTVIYDHEGQKTPILAAVGIRWTGEREVLAFRVGDRENQTAWEDLLQDLKERGVKQVDLFITDGGQAMLNALAVKFPTTPRQRCILHKLDNILSYVPAAQRESVEAELKPIFYQASREKADQLAVAFREKFRALYPTAIECMERDWEACLTFYAFPKAHWKTIRTNNVIERLFGEVKKRSHKMATAFRNEDSCLLMFYAVIRSLTFKKLAVTDK
jgi:transposase-like protein